MCKEANSMDMSNVTSSQASEAGLLPFASPDGLTTDHAGRDHAHASRSVVPVAGKHKATSGTCGRKCSGSSASAALSEYLGNRLQTQLGMAGSMEYRQTWKRKTTPAGRSYWAHTASTRRIFDKDFTGWPTCNRNERGAESRESKDKRNSGGIDLQSTANLAGWATPSSRDWKDLPGMATEAVNPDGSKRKRLDQLPRQAALILGPIFTSSHVETESTAASRPCLNPYFSAWLMGFPSAWTICGLRAHSRLRAGAKGARRC